MVPAPGEMHQGASIALAAKLYGFIRSTMKGVCRCAPYDVVLSETDVLQPDVLFVKSERRHIITLRGIVGAPDMVVEILSPGGAGYDQRKRDIYAAHGVPYYWLVDPVQYTLTTFVLQEGHYVQISHWTGDAEVSSEPFPDLRFPLSELWES